MQTQFNFENAIKKFIAKPFKYGPLTGEGLKKYEKKLKVSLPEDYRKFLLLTNGGKSIQHFAWIRKMNGVWDKIIPEIFRGVKTKESWAELASSLDGTAETELEGFLAIAYDPGGNHLWLNLNKDNNLYPFGAVYFLNHEDMPELANLNYVAPSFESYLSLVQPYDPDKDLEFETRVSRILASENTEELEKLALDPRWRLDEYYSSGNTLADQALVNGKKKIFKKLVSMGAKVPRFFLYAHKTLSQDEIAEYIKSGKLL